MVIHLSDIFKTTNFNSIRVEDISSGIRFHPCLLLAVFPACTQFGTMLLASFPSLFTVDIPRTLSAFVAVVSVLLSALVLLLIHTRGTKSFNKVSLLVVAITSVLAAVSILLVWLNVAVKGPLFLMAIAFAGAGMPFALLLCVHAYAFYSRNDVFANSLVSFAVVDCFYVVVQVFGQIFIPLMALLFGLSAVCGFVLLLCVGALSPNQDIDNKDGSMGNDEEKPKIKSLLVSVACLGTLLYMFTTGMVNVGQANEASIYVSAIGSLAVVVLSFLLYLRYRKKFTDSYSLFLLIDVGLPGFAVVAIFIKLIQLELFSSTVFLYFMKAYFLVLLMAFWLEFVQFVSLNRGAAVRCCGAVALCEALAYGVGSFCFILNDGHGIILGLVTALFLIIAVIAFGYNLILLVQSKAPDEPCEPARLNELSAQTNAEETTRLISEEFALTPRESEVLLELAYGHSSSYIAHVLYISDNTVRTHMKNIYKKLGVHSREELIEVMRSKQTEQQ